MRNQGASETGTDVACCCCGAPAPLRDNDPWEGRMDDYCRSCALTRCDAYPGECSPFGGSTNGAKE